MNSTYSLNMDDLVEPQKLEKLFSHIFFFFFSFQIFSPFFYGRTLYFEYLAIFLNPFFILYIFKKDFSYENLLGILLVGVFFSFYPVEGIKFLTILSAVLFLKYTVERRMFYLKQYVMISIFVAACQLSLLMAGLSDKARFIGPTNLSELVWGAHATETFTNFYTIFLFPRVSGLSREAGFFSSFLITGLLVIFFLEKKNKGYKDGLAFFVGLACSFSRSTLALFPAILIIKVRRFIDYLPTVLGGVVFLIGAVYFFDHIYFSEFSRLEKGSLVGRFAAFSLFDSISAKQLILGVSDLKQLSSLNGEVLYYEGYDNLFGVGGWILQYGLISYLAFSFSLTCFGVKTSGLLIILLFCSTVGLATNQNFVVLSYFLGFLISCRSSHIQHGAE